MSVSAKPPLNRKIQWPLPIIGPPGASLKPMSGTE